MTKVWTLRGVRPVVPAAGVNQRLCVYGAFNYRTGQSHYLVHPKKNAQQFREFLWQLLEAHSDRRIVLVIDNASYQVPGQSCRCWKTTRTMCLSCGYRATAPN